MKTEMDMEKCRICKKMKLKTMIDLYGICFWCKERGKELPIATEEEIKRRTDTSKMINLIASDWFTDEEIDLIIKDALDIRKYRKKVAEK